METLNNWLKEDGSSLLFILIGSIVAYYLGSKLISLLIRHFVHSWGRALPQKDTEKRQKTLSSLAITIWRIIVVFIGLVSIFKTLFPKIDLSLLFTSAGIVGVAVAFGSQTLVKDFLSGLFIVSENQYRVGDYVDINGATGKVEHVGARSTIIRDLDGNVHYIPNGTINHVINKTMGYSRVHFTISLDSKAGLDKAVTVVNKIGKELANDKQWSKKIIEAPQFDSVGVFTARSVDIVIIGKVQPSDQWSVTAEMRRRLLKKFEADNIDLA
jgi:small conductance mechanosensitive channel